MNAFEKLMARLENRARAVRGPSPAAKRDPHYPRRGLSARPVKLSEETRVRGGHKSKRRIARVWR